jgi:secreted trypsin-like serine protease
VVGALPGQLKVVAGTIDRSDLTSAVTSQVASFAQHRQFNVGAATYANDIAILTLSSPLSFTGNLKPATLWPVPIVPGTPCFIAGWGRTSSSNIPPNILQKASIPSIGTDQANTALQGTGAQTWANQLALSDPQLNVTMATTDMGGAVVCRVDNWPVVVGILSWGIKSNPTYPTVATLISSYLPWLTINTP